MTLPELTLEQRQAGTAKAAQERTERRVLREAITRGEVEPSKALGYDVAQGMLVREFLLAVPGWGTTRVDQLMKRCNLAFNKRVRGLGVNQRARLLRILELREN